MGQHGAELGGREGHRKGRGADESGTATSETPLETREGRSEGDDRRVSAATGSGGRGERMGLLC